MPGDPLVLENLAGPRTSLLVPAVFVGDDPRSCFIPSGVTTWRLIPTHGGPLPRVLPPERLASTEFELAERVIDSGHVLYLASVSDRVAVHVRWSPVWEFEGWYVNLQSPTQIKPGRWTTEDQFLDVVVNSDGSWNWKDEDELDRAVEGKRISPDEAQAVRTAATAIIVHIEAREWPFTVETANWRPDPTWPLPVVPSTVETRRH